MGLAAVAPRLGNTVKWVRRLAILAGVSLVICAMTWGLVNGIASGRPHRRERAWTTVDWSGLPMEVGGQLLLVAIAAVVGRKVLRLRL